MSSHIPGAPLVGPRSSGPRSSGSRSSGSGSSGSGRLAHPAGRVRGAHALDFDALEEIAAGLAQTAPGTDHIWTEGTRRRYACLLDTSRYDAWLIEWFPTSGLDLHDHGGSQGVVFVAAGRLVETYADLADRSRLRTRLAVSGDAFAIPARRVHEISNPGPTKAVSVHVYSPPLRSMNFYGHPSAFDEAVG